MRYNFLADMFRNYVNKRVLYIYYVAHNKRGRYDILLWISATNF